MDQATKWLDLSGKVVVVTGGSMGWVKKWLRISTPTVQPWFMPIYHPIKTSASSTTSSSSNAM